MTNILDDIWECAAEVHGTASHNLSLYVGYPRYEKKYQSEKDMAQRVMDWVKAEREKTCK